MRLSFHGADRSVTGSCHMLECAGRRILIDCGMLQGSHELSEENAADFGFDPASIDAVLLTHAHLDHCGRLPLLVKRGFRGEIIATAATRDLTRLVLLDAAHLQEEEAERHRRHAQRRDRDGKPATPLYSLLDTLECFGCFKRTAQYGRPIELAQGLHASFHDAGHILGSASVLVTAESDGRLSRVLFSGDLGNAGRPLLRPPSPPATADIVVMEATYGDRRHRPFGESVDELYAAILDTFARRGNVVIPTFALERAQEILFVLRQGVEDGRLPPSMHVFLDSPLAIGATAVFGHHPGCCSDTVSQLIGRGCDPFAPPGLRFTRETADSIAINRITGGAVIIAGSGMCTGGRVRHHLLQNLWRPEASVVFVGYAAAGTLARRIIDGAKQVRLFEEEIAVRARVHTINGFSAHADQRELIEWHAHVDGKRQTFLVHGEPEAMAALASHLSGTPVEMPEMGQALTL
jgi:metallo-beta-lactamase family protein